MRFHSGVIAAAAPANTALPAITGTAQVGQTLTASTGTWTGSPTSYSYQWKRGVTNVGSNQNTYVPVSGDVGSTITVTVTATNAGGSASATSAATSTVTAWTPAALGASLTQWCRSSTGMLAGPPVFVAASNQSLSTPDTASLAADGDWTWAGWATFTQVGANLCVASKRDGGQYEYLIFLLGTVMRVSCYNHTASAQVDLNHGATIAAGVRYFVCVRRTSAGPLLKISVDDAGQTTSATALTMTRGSAPYRLGAGDSGTLFPLAGTVQSAGFWQRAISDAEVTELYNSGTPLLYAGLSSGLKNSLSSWLDLATPTYTDAANGLLTWTANNSAGLTACSVWADQSGQSHPLVTSPSRLIPISAFASGTPALLFNPGASAWTSCDAIGTLLAGANVPFTFFCVFKARVTNVVQCLFIAARADTGSDRPTHDLFHHSLHNAWVSDRRGVGNDLHEIVGTAPLDTNPHTVIFVFDGVNGTLYLDGVQEFTGDQETSDMTIDGYTVGAHRRLNIIDSYVDGLMSEVGLVLRAINAGERASLNTYLAGLLA
jgi:hypothetical protein